MAKKKHNLGGFSIGTFLGITAVKRNISRSIGIPLTKGGIQRKVGKLVINALLGK